MSQPAPHPHHVSQLLGPALDGIIHALADRAEQTDTEYHARAEDAWTLVESFQPRDPIDLMLTGQFITINELFANTSRDILRGMPDALKQRARSSAVAMGRLALAQIGEFERRGIQPYRTEAATEQRTAQPAKSPEPTEKPQAAAASTPVPPSATAPQPTQSEAVPPVEETCWVDEPYQEWLDETPAMLAAETAMVSNEDIPSPATHTGNGSADVPSKFGPPHLHNEARQAEAMEAAADRKRPVISTV